MVDKPPQVLTYDDGACLTAADDPDSLIIDSPDDVKEGVPQIVSARITCNAGLSIVDLFTDAECSTQISGADYDAQFAEAAGSAMPDFLSDAVTIDVSLGDMYATGVESGSCYVPLQARVDIVRSLPAGSAGRPGVPLLTPDVWRAGSPYRGPVRGRGTGGDGHACRHRPSSGGEDDG